jgi:hypothetical protein
MVAGECNEVALVGLTTSSNKASVRNVATIQADARLHRSQGMPA